MKKQSKDRIEYCCKKVLEKYDVPECYVNFGSYAEDSTCIEKVKFGYVIYYASHGYKMGKKRRLTLLSAAKKLLRMYAISDKEEKEMLKQFNTEINYCV